MNTETINPRTANISKESTEGILRLINAEDATVAAAVEKAIPQITLLVDAGYETLKNGGRIVYVGCGTSGRLAVVDASECPPTYGVTPDTISAVLAGGLAAIADASEGCEDSEERGKAAFHEKGLKTGDMVIGISANGNAPFVLAFMQAAKDAGCAVGAVVNNTDSKMAALADIAVIVLTGPETIRGSTRMKAGTSQKMVLNMFSTAVMVKMGYVWGNMMINMKVSNKKLRARAIDTVREITGLSVEESEALLEKHDMSMKSAVEVYFREKV